jgi:exosortase C (VPDSG-CTERM-specific)
MTTSDQTTFPSSAGTFSRANTARKLKWLLISTLLLIACFSSTLYSLIRFTLQSDFYSYIVLIPFIGAYLAWLQRRNFSHTPPIRRERAALPLLLGLACLIPVLWSMKSGAKYSLQDNLALMTTSFLLLLVGIYLLLFGVANFRPISFPLALLVFMIPFPTFFEHALETFLQNGSASAACGFFNLFGMPVLRQGTEIHLPGFNVQVAPECSGIRSSIVLLITSLVAGYLILRANWARTLLAVAVIPLAMLRNGFRVFVLGELCVQVDPSWIDSDLHHRGGPVFFVLSLIPFFLLLALLRKFELRNRKSPSLSTAFHPDSFRGSGVPKTTEITAATFSSSETPKINRS